VGITAVATERFHHDGNAGVMLHHQPNMTWLRSGR
jgi:hypothetical protein